MDKTVIKRNGAKIIFDINRIYQAIEKAFLSANNSNTQLIEKITQETYQHIIEKNIDTISVEKIQDIVELILMQNGLHLIAKNYILYRHEHKVEREEKLLSEIKKEQVYIKVSESEKIIFNPKKVEESIRQLTPDLLRISISDMVDSVTKQVYNNIPMKEVDLLVLGAARDRIEDHYEYSQLAARFVFNQLYTKTINTNMNAKDLDEKYKANFASYINKGIQLNLLNPALNTFDLEELSKHLIPKNDQKFNYLGAQILIDRYFQKDRNKQQEIIELPQWFWMRVAMGLALNEQNKEKHAIQFYQVLSNLDLISSTPTLFNSGTNFSQMSSCYLNTVNDSLDHIFKVYADNAKLSKWAGGIGTDWSNIRATGSKIYGTNGQSQGIIPFIKIFNDVALAVNQGGKRKGAMCAYLEIWHLDFEQFLELKKNTGDERRRAHDINTAAWIPDLFMKRVENDEDWTLFCPGDTPDLHHIYGKEFEKKYIEYEANKNIRSHKIKASELWRKMITMLYETGHPWITFKDPINIRSPQDHIGVVHSSNLCTEITLNTSENETAVCNLASLNLANMITEDKKLNEEKIEKTIKIGIRMLDNVIDNNYYPTPEAKNANFKHRSIGLGLMGYQDSLYQLNIPFESEENINFADKSMEMISYYAISASAELAKERGAYETYKGSKWDRGIFPNDTISLLEKERDMPININKEERKDWKKLKEKVKKYGLRNSNIMAIAPTATIANIAGVFPCIEPAFKNIYMKENLSGNFLVVNKYLTDALDKLGIWNKEMIQKIKWHNGAITNINEIPPSIKQIFKETFEIDMSYLLKATAQRMRWIDQSCSNNIFMNTKSGKLLSDIYFKAWKLGLKTTYYLRTLAASQISKATNNQMTEQTPEKTTKQEPLACLISDPSCEACQ